MPAAPAAPPSSPPDSSAAGWDVLLLGGLALRRGGGGRTPHTITRLPSRAHVALLARLALAPQRAHAREELIELLWPGVELDVGRNRLRQVLSTLKAVLEPAGSNTPVLIADRVSLRVAPGSLDCDVLRFEHCVRNKRYGEAARLYRGELLPGYYDEWIDDERVRLAALFERLPAAVEPHATLPDPAPSPALIPAMARHQLPHYLTPLFGIEAAVARLRGELLEHRLVTLLGPGGGGKTRLAVEAARSLAAADTALPDASAPFDRVVFVALAACREAAQFDDALLAALDARASASPVSETLAAALAGRRVLLLLDNVEQLAPTATARIAALLSRLPLLQVLATSRRSLNLEGERELPLAPLALPGSGLTLGAAATQPALALFVDRARAVRADFHLSARNLDTLADLVRELEGLPLAIELAAARLRSLAPAELLAKLRGSGTPRLSLLTRQWPRGEPISHSHVSMASVIAWSWTQLPESAQSLLISLSVLRGPFGAATAIELGADLPDPGASLDELLSHSLLRQVDEVDDAPRFWPYEPVREFAQTQASAQATTAARAKLRGWALHWAAELPPTPSLPALRAELPNLVAMLQSCALDGDGDAAVTVLGALLRTFDEVPLPHEGLSAAQRALDACSSEAIRARGQAWLGSMCFVAGQPDTALALAEAGATGCAGTPDHARALHNLARMHWRSRHRADQVEPLLDTAETLEAARPDPELRAGLLTLRGLIANRAHHDMARATALHSQALALRLRLGNQHAINTARYNLAACAQDAGRHAEALALVAPVLASAREQQNFRLISQALNMQGNACCGLRDWPRAAASFHECLQAAWALMAPYDLAYGLWNLPLALIHLRQAERAVQLFAFASRFWRERFGSFDASDLRDQRRLRLLARPLLAKGAWERLWAEGEALDLAQAFALALHEPERD